MQRSDKIPIKDRNRMTPDVTILPEGQKRAVTALISGERARTYPEAAEVGEMSLGTLYTHLRRVKRNHPAVYQKVRRVRKSRPAAGQPKQKRPRNRVKLDRGSHR